MFINQLTATGRLIQFNALSPILDGECESCGAYKPGFVVKSLSLAFSDFTNESATIIGVKAKSQSYLLTRVRKGSLE